MPKNYLKPETQKLENRVLSTILTAVEFGFRECERGQNLQHTLNEAKKSAFVSGFLLDKSTPTSHT